MQYRPFDITSIGGMMIIDLNFRIGILYVGKIFLDPGEGASVNNENLLNDLPFEILRVNKFKMILIQIVEVSGYRMNQTALNQFIIRIKALCQNHRTQTIKIHVCMSDYYIHDLLTTI